MLRSPLLAFFLLAGCGRLLGVTPIEEGPAGDAGAAASGSAGHAGEGQAGEGGTGGQAGASGAGPAGQGAPGGGAAGAGGPGASGQGGGLMVAVCGNNQRESGEACDGSDLAGLDCASLVAGSTGTLTCPDCLPDTSGCAVSEPCAVSGGQPGAPWPMFRRCPSRAGRSPLAVASALHLLWKSSLAKYPSQGPVDGIISSPAVGADGTIFVGAGDGLHALSPAGATVWVFPTSAPIDASPAIGVDGTIYVSDASGVLHAVWPGGSERWSAPLDIDRASSPAIGPDGAVYVAAGQGLTALSASGETLWSFSLKAHLRTSPAFTPDLGLVVGDEEGTLHLVDAPGVLRFSVPLTPSQALEGAPAVDALGQIAVVGDAGRALVLDPKGGLLASRTTSIWLRASPAVLPSGMLFVGNDLFPLAPGGKSAWDTPLVSFAWGSPAIDASGAIFVSSGFVALRFTADGARTWQSDPMGFASSSPAIGAGGRLYVSSRVGDSSVLFAHGP